VSGARGAGTVEGVFEDVHEGEQRDLADQEQDRAGHLPAPDQEERGEQGDRRCDRIRPQLSEDLRTRRRPSRVEPVRHPQPVGVEHPQTGLVGRRGVRDEDERADPEHREQRRQLEAELARHQPVADPHERPAHAPPDGQHDRDDGRSAGRSAWRPTKAPAARRLASSRIQRTNQVRPAPTTITVPSASAPCSA
jgi:hypothetical protein